MSQDEWVQFFFIFLTPYAIVHKSFVVTFESVFSGHFGKSCLCVLQGAVRQALLYSLSPLGNTSVTSCLVLWQVA